MKIPGDGNKYGNMKKVTVLKEMDIKTIRIFSLINWQNLKKNKHIKSIASEW